MNGPLSASANERRPKQDDLRIVDRGVDPAAISRLSRVRGGPHDIGRLEAAAAGAG
jgi:hypothetical protein